MSILIGYVIKYLLARASETSTWSGFLLFATGALHMHLNPELESAIIPIGLALVGVVKAILPDKLSGDKTTTQE